MKKLTHYCLLPFYVFSCLVIAAPSEGEKPVNYIGKDLQGNKLHVSDYAGKVVIVSFWATWCTYCLKEMPILEGIQKQVGKENLQVIAVNKGEKKRLVKKISKAFKEDGIELLLAHDSGSKVAKQWGVDGIPHMVMIDRKGYIKNVHIGYGEGMLPKIIAEVNNLLRE
ncbi:TlpA disulfide reductase family protein [Teredinibacter haidensis]|uniref:TlpA disulfide reductase family protein n=1 Tax=Teredinibacter haidensis TaxID=2731755 RepID=UPI00094914C4|nr:TlpA disulfide reductase family protein [Teredinibacter haidensis]